MQGVITMKKSLMIVTALVLCITLLIMPLQVAAAAEDKKTVYISEVKVGMGETSEEASKELLAEGFTILTDSDGSYSDMNYEAGTKGAMKKGPTQKIVYIGYKTTTNPAEAITDLAVMNMNGGYSVEDYEVLMADHLEGEIKPFVNRFIAALKEYRANYKKPADTINHKRADYYRQMLNKLTDDDTGKNLGDLLLNETKYEMGDDKYNALSDAEKKTHADILTLLMQGNGRAVLLLETFITKASDDGDDTWLDRLMEISTDELIAQVKKENPALTTEADILSEFDKRYNDTAKKIVEKWDAFTEAALAYDDTVNEIMNTDINVSKDLQERTKKLDENNITNEDLETYSEALNKNVDVSGALLKAEEVSVIDYMNSTEYEDGTLLEFFTRDKSELTGEGIRSLYPMAAALSQGQIAGLDFLSIVDMFSMAIANEDGYDSLKIEGIESASFYQDVDREIYEPGGVALTNAAMRQQKNELDDDSDFLLSPLGFVFWGLTAASGIATVTTVVFNQVFVRSMNKALDSLANSIKTVEECSLRIMAEETGFIGRSADLEHLQTVVIPNSLSNIDSSVVEVAKYSAKAHFTKYLAIGFTVLTALLSAVSMVITLVEMYNYYKVTFKAIPRFMVDEADITETVNGVEKVINNQTAYYKVVRCNRKEGESDVEKDNYRVLGTANDLNGDVGKQWLALYSVKYKYGRPILADSLMVQKGSDKLPNGYETGIHHFGEGAAFNLTSEYYCYNDTPDGTYVYFRNDTETVETMTTTGNSILDQANTTGTMISTGSLALAGGLGIMLGAGIAALIMIPMMKKKETVDTE